MGETDWEHSERWLGETGLNSTLEDERFRLFFFLEILVCSLLSFLSLDLPDFLDLERFRNLLLDSPTAEEDLIKAECHELVSSESTEENFRESMAEGQVWETLGARW